VYFFVELILGRGFKGMKRGSIMMGAAMAAVTVLYAGILFTGGLGFEKRVPAAERLGKNGDPQQQGTPAVRPGDHPKQRPEAQTPHKGSAGLPRTVQ